MADSYYQRSGKKGGFSCFDMLMSNLPAFILTMIATFAGLTLTILALLTAQDFTSALLCVGKSRSIPRCNAGTWNLYHIN